MSVNSATGSLHVQTLMRGTKNEKDVIVVRFESRNGDDEKRIVEETMKVGKVHEV